MNNPPTAELEARNRASTYIHDAQQHAEHEQQQLFQKQASEFQQVILLKNMDQSYARELDAQKHSDAMERLAAEQRHAAELAARQHEAALQVRRLELGNRGLHGTESQGKQPSIWESALFKTALIIAIPILLRELIPYLFGGRSIQRRDEAASRPGSVRNRRRAGKRRRMFKKGHSSWI
jgi:hypothetical protein